ncbi:sugar phosphate isomerase/epimerase family protein [Streptomyces sp. BH106]|uniref:sugar phosphate isomerase/epimerase family protein n=1 Tax=Streptomyces sp. BH106 TaxID=3410409 RepID=UPI003CF93A86
MSEPTTSQIKLGMLTACLPSWDLERIADYAAGRGYQALEVAVWPGTGGRDFEAAHLPVATFTGEDEERTRALLDRHGLEISALAYYENHLHPDPAQRAAYGTHPQARHRHRPAPERPLRGHLHRPRLDEAGRREPRRGGADLPRTRRLRG